ncbi:MAG: DUF2953 domain-containing protein [Clostridiaceae bacterium]|nr:DUF2953 domain-containing protein [Clostridiaceae bacterium]
MLLGILIVLSILLIILLIPINISLEYVRKEGKKEARLTLLPLGKRLKIKIPLFDFHNKKGSKLFKNKKNIKEQQLPNSFSQFKEDIIRFFSNYPIYRKVFNSTMGYLRKKVICNELIFQLDIGMDDAALTGIISGMLWGTVYNVLAFFDRFFIIKKTDIKILPFFNDAVFNVKFYCIFTFRVVHIIIGFLILVFSLIKAVLKEKVFSGTFHMGKNNVRA